MSGLSTVFLLVVAIAAVFAAPAALPSSSTDEVTPVPIIAQSESNSVDGTFNYR